ncbi:MAG TPA: 30S ribosomal protein THX [Pyrinomonadaceae bacterium]|nr:30S ribosomal protein THX [Pyrinomonadaceae bacterium]
MGKGDKRTRRGKITAGSFGKSRPKAKKAVFAASAVKAAPAAEKPVKKRAPKRVPAAETAAE